jgi:hypothetical protein
MKAEEDQLTEQANRLREKKAAELMYLNLQIKAVCFIFLSSILSE